MPRRVTTTQLLNEPREVAPPPSEESIKGRLESVLEWIEPVGEQNATLEDVQRMINGEIGDVAFGFLLQFIFKSGFDTGYLEGFADGRNEDSDETSDLQDSALAIMEKIQNDGIGQKTIDKLKNVN